MDSLSEFEYFTLLPNDIQRNILTFDSEILKISRRLNKNIRKLIKYEFYNLVGNNPINEKELRRYLEDIPDIITVFIWDYHNTKSNYGVPYMLNDINDIFGLLTLRYNHSRNYDGKSDVFSLYSCVNEIIFVRNSQLVHSYSQTPHDKLHI